MSTTLWDVEDAADAPRVRDMTVAPVSTEDVREFARRYHYTKTGSNANWRWGLWHGVVLHGVVSYNLPTRSVCASVFGEEHLHRVWHMGRLILSEDSPRNSESRLNALYTGTGGDPTYYVDSTGKRRGTHLDGHGVSAARAESMGWTRHAGGVKHRYVYVLGNKTQRRERMRLLRLPILPYPKAEAAA